MSIADKRRYAAAGFVTLLLLSVVWPSPIVSTNRLTTNRLIGVDELSFLGREAPAWDVVFWCIAGLFALLIVQSGNFDDVREPWVEMRSLRFASPPWPLIAGAIAMIAVVWLFLDRPVLAWMELIRSEATQDVFRYINRFGGGANPALVVIFFLLAGVAYRQRQWITYAVAMGVAGLSAGLIAQALKLIIGRTRPELWLGPFHYARGGANSFPSGHTVGAFALAGVLIFASRNLPLRVAAALLASAVGFARLMAFRHWTSDVVASALIGLACAYASTSAKFTLTRREQPASSIVTP